MLRVDMAIMVLASMLLALLLLSSARMRLGRRGGVLLLLMYGLYVAALLAGVGPLSDP